MNTKNTFKRLTDPEERVQRPVLHVLGEDHDRAAGRDDALQVDDVGMLELSHDARLAQEVPPLLLRVAALQRLNGHVVLLLPRDLQPASTHLPELALGGGGG